MKNRNRIIIFSVLVLSVAQAWAVSKPSQAIGMFDYFISGGATVGLFALLSFFLKRELKKIDAMFLENKRWLQQKFDDIDESFEEIEKELKEQGKDHEKLNTKYFENKLKIEDLGRRLERVDGV